MIFVAVGTVTVVVLVLFFWAISTPIAMWMAVKDSQRMSVALADDLMKQGKHEEALEVMKGHAEVLRLLSRTSGKRE